MKSYTGFEKVKGSGKGVYITIAVCVCALGLSVLGIYYSAKRAENIITPSQSDTQPYEITESTTLTDETPAGKKQTGVADERTTETTTQKTTTTQPESTTKPVAAKPEDVEYVLPLGTDISKDYSSEAPVYSATMNDWRVHSGIDFSGEEGAQIKAVADGTVTGMFSDELWGTVIEIAHEGGVVARYCGLEQGTTVIKGDDVKSGEVIGCLGTIPCEEEDGFHLHFEMKKSDKITDPLEILTKHVNASNAE